MTRFGLRRHARATATLAALATLTALAATAAGATAPAPVSWGRALTIDTSPLTALACPSTRLCAATDAAGGILTTSSPTHPHPHWQRDAAAAALLTALACPSPRLCVATASNGDVLVSTTPATGPWSALPVDPSEGLTALACPSSRLCLATDAGGDVLVSHHPAGGAQAWTLTHIDHAITYACRFSHVTGTACQAGLDALACPSARLCVATDSGGYVLVSHDPTGARTWRALGHPKPVGFGSVSCPTSRLCLLSGGFNGDIVALDPSHPRTLRAVATPQGGSASLAGVWCANSRLCFTADQGGGLFTSTVPTGPAPDWPLVAIRHSGVVSALACRPRWCLAADGAGAVAVGRLRPSR